jgi:acid phosphatase type 7
MAEKVCRHLQVLILLLFLSFFCIVPTVALETLDHHSYEKTKQKELREVPETPDGYWAPWVTKTTTNSATINWRGEPDGSGVIEYATSSYFNQYQKFDKTISSNATAQYQHVLLTGLEPNTSYTYWVRPSGDASAFGYRTFRTMPVSGPFTFIVIGDTREGINYSETRRFKYVADAIAKEPNVLFVLHDGDFCRQDYEPQWATFFQCADRMLAKSTFFPAIGNHEYHERKNANLDEEHYNACPERCAPCNQNCAPATDAVNYKSAFNMPLNYSFDCAGVRFIVLNSPDPNSTCCDDPHTSLNLSEDQAPWLERLLEDNMSKGTFTIHHHPIWDAGSTNHSSNLEPWENLYHKYKISANFAGHTHNYQRYNISGIPYFVVGNGGAPNDDVNNSTKYPIGLQSVLPMQLGYLKVSVDPANNTATAWEITVGKLTGLEDNETPQLYNPPVINDTITFPLKANVSPPPASSGNASKTINKEHIEIGNKYAAAYESGSAMNNIAIVTSQGH